MTLQEICDELPAYQKRVTPQQAIARFRGNINFDPNQVRSLGKYIRFFSKIYALDLPLEMMAKEHSEIKLSNEIPYKRAGSYALYYDTSKGLLARLRKGPPESKKPIYCGNLVRVNGIPVIFDVLIAKALRGAGAKTDSIVDIMEADACRRRLEPVEECFGQKVRLVLVVPKDEYNWLEEKNHPVYRAFEDRGGITVPFYYNRHGFINGVKKIIQVEGFKLS